MSLKLGTQDIAGISQNTKYNAHHLLDFKWTDCIMSDVSWLRADTFSWQSGDVYVTAYNHLVQDIQGITAETETIGSYTVTFYRATDGHKICLANQEQTVLNIYNTYGIAWYYILDTTNIQFKLPRTKYGFEGLRTNVGDNINESLPIPSHTHTRGDMQISGSIWQVNTSSNTGANGAFGVVGRSTTGAHGSGTSNGWTQYDFYASRSWTGSTSQPNDLPSTYQDNAPVQERATQMYLYFYVGDYTQTAVEQTSGLNSELFNGKADIDLANVNDQAKILMGGMAMPSDTYEEITLGASGTTYIAPADGYYCVLIQLTGAWSNMTLVVNSHSVYCGYCAGVLPIGNTIAVKKGDVLTVYYSVESGTPTKNTFRFYYAVGSESEAS